MRESKKKIKRQLNITQNVEYYLVRREGDLDIFYSNSSNSMYILCMYMYIVHVYVYVCI